MLKKYNLFWDNEKIGIINYNVNENKFEAILLSNKTRFPRRLFGFNGSMVANDEQVRHYIKNTVCPPDRENIDDILRELKISKYDAWEIYKAYSGRNANDYCHIEEIDEN